MKIFMKYCISQIATILQCSLLHPAFLQIAKISLLCFIEQTPPQSLLSVNYLHATTFSPLIVLMQFFPFSASQLRSTAKAAQAKITFRFSQYDAISQSSHPKSASKLSRPHALLEQHAGGEGDASERPRLACVKVWRRKRTCSAAKNADIQIAVRGQLRNEIMHVCISLVHYARTGAAFGGVNSQLATLTATIFRPFAPAFILSEAYSTQCAPFKSIQSGSLGRQMRRADREDIIF
jgi:hypothetical protein